MIKTKVYVAGAISPRPNRGHPVIQFLTNIRKGLRGTNEALLAGYQPFSPFTDFLYWLQLQDGETITEEMIKGHSMGWLEQCDAVLVLSDWEGSGGTLAEILRATELGIPVFYSLEDLLREMPPEEGK
jgi:nucleoside 2-deoxyribosyltransferase